MQHPVRRRIQEFLKCTHLMLFVNSYWPLFLYVYDVCQYCHEKTLSSNIKLKQSVTSVYDVPSTSPLLYYISAYQKLVKFGVSDIMKNHSVKTYNLLNSKQLLVIELLDEYFFMGITVHSTWIQFMVRLL